jgi:hypothetical protein
VATGGLNLENFRIANAGLLRPDYFSALARLPVRGADSVQVARSS